MDEDYATLPDLMLKGKRVHQGSEIVSMNAWGFPGSVLSLLERVHKFSKTVGNDDITSEFISCRCRRHH